MIKKESIIKYHINCDNCGKTAIHEKKIEPEKETEEDDDDMYEMMKKRLLRDYSTKKGHWMDLTQDKYYAMTYGKMNYFDEKVTMAEAAQILPGGWIQRDNGKIVCSEECLIELIKKDAEETTKKELEKHRKKILTNLKK